MTSKLSQISDIVSALLTRDRVCESCGKEFSCGASLQGCWCSEINLGPEARADLKARFHDCLCRSCLEQSAANHLHHSPSDVDNPR